MRAPWRRIRAWAVRLALLLLLVGGGGFGVFRWRQAQGRPSLPSTPVRKGEFLVLIRCRGSLAARSSVGVYTPVVPNLRIAWIAPAGDFVKAGDVILRFDSSTAKQELMQKQAQLQQIQATLDQALAQGKIIAQQDQTAFSDSKFSVELARTQVKQSEVKSYIEGEQAKIDLGVSEQKLKVQEATVALHEASNASRIASLTRQRDQVQTDLELTKSRITQMELKAPNSGLLMLNMNYSGVMTTADAKPYKVGDTVSSNMSLGQIPDLTTLEMNVKLEEADRGRVAVGQDALLRVDALPELTVAAKVTQLSSLAELTLEYPYTRSFRAYAAVTRPDNRLRPDMNGGMDIIVNRIPNAISIPSKALFTRAGKPIVYLAEHGAYRAVEVEVQARNPDEVAITGVREGATVALVDISKGQKK